MNTLQGITSQPKQQLFFVLEDESRVDIYLEYRPQQKGWFANVAWQDWAVDGLRIVSSPNLLHKWQNILPFGLAIITARDADPLNVTDFADGTSAVTVLNETEVGLVTTTAFPGM